MYIEMPQKTPEVSLSNQEHLKVRKLFLTLGIHKDEDLSLFSAQHGSKLMGKKEAPTNSIEL